MLHEKPIQPESVERKTVVELSVEERDVVRNALATIIYNINNNSGGYTYPEYTQSLAKSLLEKLKG